MSFNPRDTPGSAQGSTRPPGSQGAARGRRVPDAPSAGDDEPQFGRQASQRGSSFGGRGGFGGSSRTFLGLPVALIYAIGVAVIGLVFIGAVCSPGSTTGSVAGQVKALSADRSVSTLAGAQVVLRGRNETYTTVSTEVDPNAEGTAAYNYRFENIPAGTYTMAVTPPPGSGLQPEDNITLEIEGGELFPQSVLLLAEGIQKPRPLAPSELEPGQVGYINERGERVVYQQGGIDWSDALLLYLLWRNPPAWGYGAPPIIVTNPGGSTTTGSNYRVTEPPSRTQSGQTVTQRRPSVPGQGSTRPSSSTGASGPGPTYNSGSRQTDAAPPAPYAPSTGAGAGSSSGSSSSSGSTTTRPSAPSQGVSRPSSSTSRPATSSGSSSRPSAPSRPSSGGGRR